MASNLNFFPALKAHIGPVDRGWTYYTVKMRMAQIVHEIKFAHEFDLAEDKVSLLGDAIQRALNNKRIRESICRFLQKDHRFFSSLVAGVIDGNPEFFPVSIAGESEVERMFRGSGIDDSFGVLRLDNTRQCFALDGQHRLAAIRSMLDGEFRMAMGIREKPDVPDGFADEELSVIMVLRAGKDAAEFRKGFRRLFSSLNRYAKKTDKDTDIIMDEDDAFALLTRRMVTEFPFFRDETNPESMSSLVKMKGTNLQASDVHFTTLQTLYAMNTILLRTEEREKDKRWRNSKAFLMDRPEEGDLNQWFEELTGYWEAILKAMPALGNNPQKMRHPSDDPSETDHLFFRPIGQKMMARLVRELLDGDSRISAGFDTVDKMAEVLAPLGDIDWDIRNVPWQRLVSVPGQGGKGFVMREEQREQVLKVAQRIAKAMIVKGADEKRLRADWETFLNPRPETPKEIEELWNSDIKPKLKL